RSALTVRRALVVVPSAAAALSCARHAVDDLRVPSGGREGHVDEVGIGRCAVVWRGDLELAQRRARRDALEAREEILHRCRALTHKERFLSATLLGDSL